jgi:hypothetical protein
MTWTCLICGDVHPIDHEGMFAGSWMICCSCELVARERMLGVALPLDERHQAAAVELAEAYFDWDEAVERPDEWGSLIPLVRKALVAEAMAVEASLRPLLALARAAHSAAIDSMGWMVAEIASLRAALDKAPLRTFDQTAADALADEVNVLVRRKIIDSRSPAADALLSYRDPPASPRGDRLAELEAIVDVLNVKPDTRCPRCHTRAPNPDGCALCNVPALTARMFKTIGEVARLKDERDLLKEALGLVLASASPNERDHPAMSAAWARARLALVGARIDEVG